MSSILTKQDIHRKIVVKYNGLDPKNNNMGYLNILLYNMHLLGFVSYEKLTLKEKESINLILSGKHKTFYYDQKTKRINFRGSKNTECEKLLC